MSKSSIKIAINGFGRIGRLFFRQSFNNQKFEIVAINDLGDINNLAYLLKHDSVYRTYDKKVEVKSKSLIVAGKEVIVLQEKDPAKLPWSKLGVDVVVEATGVFNSYEKAKAHISAGAKRVVITAPAKDSDDDDSKTVLIGINERELKSCALSSNGSCTTNAASPVIQVLLENPGIEKAILNTIHGYTASQALVDGPTRGHDFRRGRAAAQNIIPSTTGAAIAVTRVIPDLVGKFDGIAFRVPVIAGSVADITFLAKRNTSVEEINEIIKKASGQPRWKGILGVVDDQITSSDIIGESYGAVVDLGFTKVVDGNLVKVVSWYDNEWGYVTTLVRHISAVVATV